MMEPVVVDQSEWGIVRVTGADRVRFMQGMVIGDVAAIDEGGWLRTAMLSVKGRVVSIFDIAIIANSGDELILICQPGHRDETIAGLSKYAIMDDVEFEPIAMAVHRVWSDPQAVWTAPPIWQEAPSPSPAERVEVRRIEAGLPLLGVDVGDKNFPFESTLAQVINYEKGCYVGQEPVHRVHAKGQGQKMLRALRFPDGSSGAGAPAIGAVVSHRDRENAGVISSAAVSPDFGPIALATLHRSAFDPGDSVTCEGREATIASLPLVS